MQRCVSCFTQKGGKKKKKKQGKQTWDESRGGQADWFSSSKSSSANYWDNNLRFPNSISNIHMIVFFFFLFKTMLPLQASIAFFIYFILINKFYQKLISENREHFSKYVNKSIRKQNWEKSKSLINWMVEALHTISG